MTKEEAIKIIKRYDVNFCDNDGNPISAEFLSQAFDMAIKSLEAWGKVKTKIEEAQSSIFCTEDENTGLEIALILIDNQISEVSE